MVERKNILVTVHVDASHISISGEGGLPIKFGVAQTRSWKRNAFPHGVFVGVMESIGEGVQKKMPSCVRLFS